jgi:DNA-binding NtrC family response regulator
MLRGALMVENVDPQTSPVMVTDSDSIALAATAKAVRFAGYPVTTARSFHEAKYRMEASPPSLLIADVRLGAFNGLHLVWQRHLTHPGLPSIVTDVVMDPTLEAEASNLGASYLIKPVRAEELYELLAALFKPHAGTSADSLGAPRMWWHV